MLMFVNYMYVYGTFSTRIPAFKFVARALVYDIIKQHSPGIIQSVTFYNNNLSLKDQEEVC